MQIGAWPMSAGATLTLALALAPVLVWTGCAAAIAGGVPNPVTPRPPVAAGP